MNETLDYKTLLSKNLKYAKNLSFHKIQSRKNKIKKNEENQDDVKNFLCKKINRICDKDVIYYKDTQNQKLKLLIEDAIKAEEEISSNFLSFIDDFINTLTDNNSFNDTSFSTIKNLIENN